MRYKKHQQFQQMSRFSLRLIWRPFSTWLFKNFLAGSPSQPGKIENPDTLMPAVTEQLEFSAFHPPSPSCLPFGLFKVLICCTFRDQLLFSCAPLHLYDIQSGFKPLKWSKRSYAGACVSVWTWTLSLKSKVDVRPRDWSLDRSV